MVKVKIFFTLSILKYNNWTLSTISPILLLMDTKKKLAIVTGASGALGTAYLEKLRRMQDFTCLGITRQTAEESKTGMLSADLLNASEVATQIAKIDLSFISEVFLIHPVGKFAFEQNGQPRHDQDGDGIDDEVFRSNVETFHNIVSPLLTKLNEQAKNGNPIPMTMCAFGSVSDCYEIPYWQSYARAKGILRNFMHSLVDYKPNGLIRGLMINLSSVDTENERTLRPSADKTYWLKCEEIVEQTMMLLLQQGRCWQEIDILKPDPNFEADYYLNLQKILEKWTRETRIPEKKEGWRKGPR